MNLPVALFGVAQLIVLIKTQGFDLRAASDAQQMVMSVVAIPADGVAAGIGDTQQPALGVIVQGLAVFVVQQIAVVVVVQRAAGVIVGVAVGDFHQLTRIAR
ncbi:hypothetical protein D3C84_840000 [compost metagenome]